MKNPAASSGVSKSVRLGESQAQQAAGNMTPRDPNDIRRGLVAERRSLLITSFVLFFYEQAGLRIDKINVLGNEVSLSDPWWVSFAIWTLWLYFFLRYLQYFMETLDTGISDAYGEWMKKVIRRSAFRRFKKSFVPDEKHEKYIGVQPSFVLQGTSFPLAYPEFWSVELKIDVGYVSVKKDGAMGLETIYKEDLESARLFWTKCKAVICVLFLTQGVTEYFLPFVVALLPLGSLLWRLRGAFI